MMGTDFPAIFMQYTLKLTFQILSCIIRVLSYECMKKDVEKLKKKKFKTETYSTFFYFLFLKICSGNLEYVEPEMQVTDGTNYL